ncbi:MAG TPA: arginine--tRNA ligase [Candidatus Eisenbacteria bacterium]|nr:arginine--tRNA ligase [Candidatus Eisenbacteria bacterium]
MVWNELNAGLDAALWATGLADAARDVRVEWAIPRERAHGDWTTNVALALAKPAGRPPRAIAEALAAAFPRAGSPFASVEVAGPGFLNLRYAPEFLAALPGRIMREAGAFGRSTGGAGTRVLIEYVSANPTGPLNVVSARAAAVGATLVRLLAATGHDAVGEFYVNDTGRQVDLLGLSLRARFLERTGATAELPEGGYVGGYLVELARELPEREARAALGAADGGLAWFQEQALARMLAWQQRDLADYGASFARWFRESELHRSGAVNATLDELEQRGVLYRAEAAEGAEAEADDAAHAAAEGAAPAGLATFLRTSAFGDDKDRVVVRSDGRPTYLLPDIAYHRDKAARGFRHAIDLWGPDHHGYIPRMRAALAALGLPAEFFDVIIVQQVNLKSGGQPVKMSKRAGEFVTLRDLMDDIGADCAKFLFLVRSTSAHLDFDLDLARRQNDENPAYYVQYAHARIASILRFARERGLEAHPARVRLDAAEEVALVRTLATFPEVVRGAAAAHEPHRIPTYLVDTAATFHRFYHACRVVGDDVERSRGRLAIAEAARQVLANGLALLGVSAPERMERAAEVEA